MSDTPLVLCIYTGGTIGMIKSSSGYAPFPSFLTEMLRSQSRFHDPHSSSIFSWTDSMDRYKAWSEAQTRPTSGSNSPKLPQSPSHATAVLRAASDALAQKTSGQSLSGNQDAKSHPQADSAPGFGRTLSSNKNPTSESNSTVPPFAEPVLVKSSSPKMTSKAFSLSTKLSDDGQILDLLLPTLITPQGKSGKRVRYAVLEYDPLLDSSEMEIEDWIRLSKDISLNYQNFDSFIVLHGTDTMCYTSSALSMLLENLGKSVIVTGAQVPLSELRNDAIENVLGALTLAGSYRIPEVSLYFNSQLFRGNRVSKTSNNALAAFSSPNMPPLAHVGINIDVSWELIQRPKEVRPLRAHDKMCSEVNVLRLFPGLTTSTVKTFLAEPIKGVILESYGAGNAPSRKDLLETFREASERGVVIVNITQCLQGEVSAIYAVGKKLESVGVVAGGDMTPECALTKLSYLLGKEELTPTEVRKLMARPLRGELTTSTASSGSLDDEKESEIASEDASAALRRLLARVLSRPIESREQEEEGVDSVADILEAEKVLLPYLIHKAAVSNDIPSLKSNLSRLSHLSSVPRISVSAQTAAISSAGTTSLSSSSPSIDPLESSQPLHAASSLGNLEAVRLLLNAGSSVHLRDPRDGHTPLFLAAKNGHGEVVRLIKEAGGHLNEEETSLGLWLSKNSNGDQKAWEEAMGRK